MEGPLGIRALLKFNGASVFNNYVTIMLYLFICVMLYLFICWAARKFEVELCDGCDGCHHPHESLT